MSKGTKGIFAKITNGAEAVHMARDAAKCFFFLAALQAVAAFILDLWILLDAGIYATCGFFILKLWSRTAALVVLVLATVGLIVTILNKLGMSDSGGKNIFLALITFWVALRSLEATWKIHGVFSSEIAGWPGPTE